MAQITQNLSLYSLTVFFFFFSFSPCFCPAPPPKGPERPISAGELASLRELNALDVVLYAHAAELFEARLTSMRDALPPAIATLAFKSDSKVGPPNDDRPTDRPHPRAPDVWLIFDNSA